MLPDEARKVDAGTSVDENQDYTSDGLDSAGCENLVFVHHSSSEHHR